MGQAVKALAVNQQKPRDRFTGEQRGLHPERKCPVDVDGAVVRSESMLAFMDPPFLPADRIAEPGGCPQPVHRTRHGDRAHGEWVPPLPLSVSD